LVCVFVFCTGEQVKGKRGHTVWYKWAYTSPFSFVVRRGRRAGCRS